MESMKSRLWMMIVGVCLVMGGVASVFATNYYIDDDSNVGDVYTPAFTGNDSNSGVSPDAPKRTVNALLAATNLVAGDVVYIDTGIHTNNVVIGSSVVGEAGNRILFQGSTNFAAGGTVFIGSGNLLSISGKYLYFCDIRAIGGGVGFYLNGANFCELERLYAISNSTQSIRLEGASSSNAIRRCVLLTINYSALGGEAPGKGNYVENCIARSLSSAAFAPANGLVSNLVGCIGIGVISLASSSYNPDAGAYNILYASGATHSTYETLTEFQRVNTNWYGNVVADPKFVNADALDFHLLSASGFVSNGVWVTNAAVGYSPAIDFGPVGSTAWTNEPDPNGGRVDAGLYGGTAEASKSRTNAWLFAMTFNDGGTLWGTGKFEWVGGNLGTGATVNLQFSTNNGVAWSNMATEVAATNESYSWAPAFDYPAVLWRVVSSTNSAVASTNSKPFSVRTATNTTFTFYVNDGSQVGDVYCTAVGNRANDGAAPERPKRGLRDIISAYQLRGGDTVYVDTGSYVTNVSTTFSLFDRGDVDRPLRILGSSSGTVLRSSSTAVDVLEISNAGYIEFENLRLAGGRYGLYANGASNVLLRTVFSSNNTWGVYLAGNTRGMEMDRCVIAANTNGGISANEAGMQSNRWNRGVIWNNPVAITASSNALTVSNSVLGGGATLFGNHAVVGDFNVVGPPTVPGAGFSTFSDLQNAGRGWARSVRADPLFANAAAGDFHLKSLTGRYNPATGLFVTNDLVYSPAIDFGDPGVAVGDEPLPNGNRVNAGLHGGTFEASLSRTNEWVQLLSHNDGGTMNVQAGSWVRWEAGGYAPGATISIWISRDAGVSWELLAGGVAVTNGSYFYQNPLADDSSSVYGRLRVSLDDVIPSSYSQSPTNFTYRNGTFSFFINDSSLAGDVYCTAAGNDNNLGTSAGAPMRNLHALFEKYTILSPGDRVYIDTGLHTATNTIVLTSAFSGSATNPVTIMGSTNRVAGGSVLNSGSIKFDIRPGASNIVIRDVAITNVATGVSLSGVSNVRLDGIEVRSASSRAFQVLGNSRDVDLMRCVSHGGNLGVLVQQSTNVFIRHGVFWENTTAGLQVSGVTGCMLENSIVASTRIGGSLMALDAGTGWASDYNGLYAGPDTFIGTFGGSPSHNLRAWQKISGGQDLHSIPGDPLIASPEGMDYHLRTEQTLGRLLPNGQRTSDDTSSPLLDAGNPASAAWTNEPAPNGRRVNIGRWGGTVEASMASTVPWIRTVSFGDAGGVSNETLNLLWTAGGFSNETAKVEVSLDGGKTWNTTVASGVPITNGTVAWNTAGLPNSPAGIWRVVCLQQTNVVGQSTQFFSIRNGGLDIYVAPIDVLEPVYVSAAGLADNWQATSNAPLSSLRTVFSRFDLEPGDRIWVDTGNLVESFPIQIGMKNSGSTLEPVRIIGNTQKPYNGTSLSLSQRSGNVFNILRAGGVKMESLSITNAQIGVRSINSGPISFDRVRVAEMSLNGILASSTPQTMTISQSILEQASLEATGAVVNVQHSLIRNGDPGNICINNGTVNVRNSILESSGFAGYIYYYKSATGTLISDYNNIRVMEGANVAGGGNRPSDRYLIDWQIRTVFSNDMNSFGYEPNFFNREGYDFHLKSEYGRYDPEVSAFVTNDVLTSHLIDLGDPSTTWSNEPNPNGGRVNVGLYGGTDQASKSPGQGALVPLTMSDGGTVRGEVKLYWSLNGVSNNAIVKVQFSPDGGGTWMDIATNVYADVGISGLTWLTTNFPSTAMGVWRVMTTNESPLIGQTETLFALKNEPLRYYINDASVAGDVYCTETGSSANTGASPDSPVDSFNRLFVLHQVDHGDTIYVDTGTYPLPSIGISAGNSSGESRLLIQGSTNEAAGGTVITNTGGTAVLSLNNVNNVDLRDLNLHGGQVGLRLSAASSNHIHRVRSFYAMASAFYLGVGSDQNEFSQCSALHFLNTGVVVAASAQVSIPTTNSWLGGVIVSIPSDFSGKVAATGILAFATSGRLNVSNSVFMASGPLDTIYIASSNVIRGDYNVYHRERQGAVFAKVSDSAPYGVQSKQFDHLNTWTEWNGSDANSMAAEPKFTDLSIFDLHPRSMGGRYAPQFGTFLIDPDNSPLIDAANPAMNWSEESEPNGSRANVGVYGGTKFASRTPSNNDVFVLTTLNEGGLVRGTNTLRWFARGGATNAGHLVNLQLSTNSGVNWQTIVSGVPALQGYYEWNTTAFPSRPTLRWRVSSQSEITWQATSERDFVNHNLPIAYYVNDFSRSNDLYCLAIGSTNNTGLTSASPLPSLKDVLDRYDLEAGDTVYLDTGVYTGNVQTVVGYLDSGTASSPVTLQGSTQYPGSVYTGNGLALWESIGVKVRNVRFQAKSAFTAAEIKNSQDVTFEFVDVLGGGDGITISGSSNVLLRNFSVIGLVTNGIRTSESFNTRLEYGTIWSNGLAQVVATMGSNEFVIVSNCIMGSYGLRRPIYQLSGSNNLVANFNNLYLENGSLAALRTENGFPREYNSVGRWSTVSGMDRNSLSHFPFFADVGTGDVHLKSSAGRFDPTNRIYVLEDSADENSPLIDAGAPSAPYGSEPSPNGGRVNMGRFGNTAEASKTPTNGTLTLISFNDGGQVSGTNVVLRWLARGAATNGTVSIGYSSDGGSNWVTLVSGISAGPGMWTWDSTTAIPTVQGQIRISGSDGSEVVNCNYFSVRNQPFKFYINDNSTSNDVYCSAVGDNLNSGLTNSAPMADLNALLAKYGMAGGDTVYIDTGTYRPLTPWRIGQAASAGWQGDVPVVFQGSTNAFPSETIVDRGYSSGGIAIEYAVGVELRNITVSRTLGSAVSFRNSVGVSAEWVTAESGDTAFQLEGGNQLKVAHAVGYDCNQGVVVGSAGKDLGTPVRPTIENCVFWLMSEACIRTGGNQPVIRNNILSVVPGKYVYEISTTNDVDSDYNSIWLGEGGRMFRRTLPIELSPVPIIYETVGKWAAVSGQDLHSYDGDPMLANPELRNFRLKSQAGRWDPELGVWTNDMVSSPLIDAGDPDSAGWTNEPWANGGRINIGPFGGSRTSSKSPTNAALYLLSLNRGGVASGQVALNWRAAGRATGHTVRVSMSIDNGSNWTAIASGLAAKLGGVLWNSYSLSSSPVARWKVESEQQTNLMAVSELPFVLHNEPIRYYVNDDSADGDVWCTSVGHSGNTGLLPSSPKRWVMEAVDSYDLEPGDIVYIDTGHYYFETTTVVGDLDAGEASQDGSVQVTFQGSTNVAYGGSLFVASDPELTPFVISNTYGVRLRNLDISGAANGVKVQGSVFIAGDWLSARGGSNGVLATASSNIVVQHSAFVGNYEAGVRFSHAGTLSIGSCVLWSNKYGLRLDQGRASVQNSILGMVAPESCGYLYRSDREETELSANYNNLFVSGKDSAVASVVSGTRTSSYYSVARWNGTLKDLNSLAHDPLLADPGKNDFHLKSTRGRWQPGVGGGWAQDNNNSPLLDAGNSNSLAWLSEPEPNGRRLNIGMYGGSPEASKTPVEGWLTMLSLYDGGFASGNVDLKWESGGAASNYTVCIEYSSDNGISWTNIVCNWPASSGGYSWDSSLYGASALGRWRMYCIEDSGITAISAKPFVLRNGGVIRYYVNDASTNNSLYTTAPGDDDNDGLTPATPKANLQAILDSYELEPEDVIYVDAGSYIAGAPPITFDQRDSGSSNLYLTVQGSTNPLAPTVFSGSSFGVPGVFSLRYANNWRFRDFTIRNAGIGVVANESVHIEFENVRVENNRNVGLFLNKSEDIRLVHSVLWKNASPTGGVAVVLQESTAELRNCVAWGQPTAILIQQGSATVSNSVLDSSGVNGRIYAFTINSDPENFKGDYNCYVRKNGSIISEKPQTLGGSDFYNTLPSWSAVTFSDQHSMTLDPEFADEISGDFHPKSTQGRFKDDVWLVDPVLSPLIDAGGAADICTNEPLPNGGIVNIGAYGNTVHASMTQTNSPWLKVVSYNDNGDVISGNALLYWLHGGMASNAFVRLEYSSDQVSWKVIASNVPAGSRQYLWEASSLPLTVALNWRVVLQADEGILDISDNPVAIKTGTFDYYINDTNTAGDVWCTGPGLPWSDEVTRGTNRSTPLNSLKTLLEKLPVSGGDRIYLDTGAYPVAASNQIVFNDRNMGSQAFPLSIYGSTNVLAGGTIFQGNGTANGIRVQNTRHIELNDIRITGMQNGISVDNVDTLRLRGIEIFNNQSNAVAVSSSGGIDIRNGLFWNNGRYGYFSGGQKGAESIQNATVWGNRAGAISIGLGYLNIQNCILGVTNSTLLYTEDGQSAIGGDYNLFSLVPGALLGSNSWDKVTYGNLRQWQNDDRDAHSSMADPQFVDPTNGNFHLQSRMGWWSNGTWVISAESSWAIDAGDPAETNFVNEPAPNGGRVNLGFHGGTRFASKTDSTSGLFVLSLRDGGTASELQYLHWLCRGIAATNLVRVEYSPDRGATWILLGLAQAGNSPLEWYSAADPTPEALWRVVLAANTNILDTTPTNFIHRTRPLVYYVNDNNLTGDIYTKAVGSATNRGYVSNSPLHSVQAVLERYPLAGGDEVRMDTGSYSFSEPVFISKLHSGETGNPAKLLGSTNVLSGGTRIVPADGMDDPAFILYQAQNVDLSWLRLIGFTNGVSIQLDSSSCRLLDIDIQGATGSGILLSQANGNQLRRVVLREGRTNAIDASQSNFKVFDSVIWSNRGSALSLGKGVEVEVTNSIIEASGAGRYAYFSSTTTVIRADYNDLFLREGGQIASINGTEYPRMPQWNRFSLQDRFSLSTDPLFANPTNGDFHLRSVAGRYQYGLGWVQDVANTNLPNFSPLIDMGAPTTWSNEPSPNGSRRNMGLYGDTWQASKSNTNRWLQAITVSGGGLAYGGFPLTWGYGGGIGSNEVVRLQYSYEDGTTENWVTIIDTTVGSRQYYWQSDQLLAGLEKWPTSPAARWRLFLLGSTNILDMTDVFFGLRNSPFRFFVNDSVQDGDVYTTRPGNDSNMGFYPAGPKRNVQSLLDAIDLEPTDQVYVDTGDYYLVDTNSPIRWELKNSGGQGQPVWLRGSTNEAGTWFIATNRFSTEGFFFMNASNVDVRGIHFIGESITLAGNQLTAQNLTVSNGSMKVSGNQLVFTDIQVGNGNVTLQGNYSSFTNMVVNRGNVSLSGINSSMGFLKQRFGAMSLVGTNVTLLNSSVYATNNLGIAVDVNSSAGGSISNCTIVSIRGTALRKRGVGTLRSQHNILVAGGSDANSVISWESGNLISDWNDLVARGSAWLGSRNGRWERLAYWRTASGQDGNSVSVDPLFADESAGDFHLQSVTGRWNEVSSNWVSDAAHSPVIDLGNPALGAGTELFPNGSRRNLGAYGGTTQASKSKTGMWLTALAANDGGVMKGSNVVLRWAAPFSGQYDSFLLRYSPDGGASWTNIVTGVGTVSGIGTYLWNSTGFADSFNAMWQVLALDGSGVQDTIDASFSLRNQAKNFYVNDLTPEEDIYTTEPGNDANDGLTPATPKQTLQAILNAYDLEGGDTVYVDAGAYPSASDVRMIWSRSGSSNAPLVIQGNTNGAFSLFSRTGNTNFPAVGLDVKGSDVTLRHLAFQGMDRGVYLESNRNAKVEGFHLLQTGTGISVLGSRDTQIRNTGFWKNGRGVTLSNTSTSVLENLTFALSGLSGIQLENTEVDTLQNNIFIPLEGAYAYSIGGSTSLLLSATMDYNLYDFGQTNSGFFDGATRDLRRWQLGMNKDFRSAITNALLADAEGTGDLHPQSEFGRWSPTGWVNDAVTSWAVDHGNPTQDFRNEPTNHGTRINIGMYGNTPQASQGSTITNYEVRTLNEGQNIQSTDQIWPMIWSAHLVDSNEWVLVQFSSDGGDKWLTLTNVNAYQEYYIWQAQPQFQTVNGRWRVIGESDPTLWAVNVTNFTVKYTNLAIVTSPRPTSGLMRFDWEGGVGGFRYRIEYSDDFGQTWNTWAEKYNGPAFINKSNFVIPAGEAKLLYTFEDRTSYLRRTRMYRIWQIP